MSAIKEVEVRSLGELIEHATPTVPDPASGRLRDYAVYRGAADANWPLLSSLDRLGGVTPPGTKLHLENDIFRNFLRYAHAGRTSGAQADKKCHDFSRCERLDSVLPLETVW